VYKINDILRLLRLEKKLSQQNVADDLGLSLTGYAKIERGITDIPFSRLQCIASYYKMEVVDLLMYGKPPQEKLNENDPLKKEIDYLKQINALLLEKIALLEKK
jgi:transcriptional regulator with XRE-family HTH domain